MTDGFAGLDDIQVYEKLPWAEPGNYVVTVGAVKFVQGAQGSSFIIEYDIEESDNPDRPDGSRMSVVWKLESGVKGDIKKQNFKAFLAACLGKNANEPPADDPRLSWSKLGQYACGEGNIFAGTKLKLTCYNAPAKSGREYKAYSYVLVAKAPKIEQLGL